MGRKTSKWVMDKIGSVFMLQKEYGGEVDEVIWPHRPKTTLEKTDSGEDGRQAVKGQTCKDMVPGFKRLDKP